jgi:hypothetical protein
VDRLSALLEYPVEKQIPMDADHLSICKFSGPEDSNYTMVVPVLRNMANAATSGAQAASEGPAPEPAPEPSTTTSNTLSGLDSGLSTAPQVQQLLLSANEVSELEAEFALHQRVLYNNGSNPRPVKVAAVQNVGRRNESYQLTEEDGTSFQEGRWVSFQELRQT